MNSETASLVAESAAEAISRGSGVEQMIASIPAPIYVTDDSGTITHFNKACITLAGRVPRAGHDKWCVTWRIYTPGGQRVPHDECPMAVAIRERRAVRDAEAVAERPDGSRVYFVPFPTPVYSADGTFAGALNLLLDVTEQRTPSYMRAQATRCRRLAGGIADRALAATLEALADKYDGHSRKANKRSTTH